MFIYNFLLTFRWSLLLPSWRSPEKWLRRPWIWSQQAPPNCS